MLMLPGLNDTDESIFINCSRKQKTIYKESLFINEDVAMQNKPINHIDVLLNLIASGDILEAEQYCQQFQKVNEKLKSMLFQQFYSIDGEEIRQQFIRNIHARLIFLIDDLFKSAGKRLDEDSDQNKELINARKSVLLTLEDLLVFIGENFGESIVPEQKIPMKLRDSFIREKSEELLRLSLTADGPDRDLFETVKASVQNRLSQPGITYGLIAYLNELVREIERVQASNREYSFSITLKDILVAYNFNSLRVVHYLNETILKEVKMIESAKDKIECLNRWLKEINQVPVKPDCAFNDWHQSMSLFLSNWIREEILFYEKGLLLFSGVYPAGIQSVAHTGYKIETELSVNQLACFVRLFTECEILKNTNVRELLNFLAEHIRSKKRENISAESLRLKYYNIEESTREEVRKVLFRLLKKSSIPM